MCYLLFCQQIFFESLTWLKAYTALSWFDGFYSAILKTVSLRVLVSVYVCSAGLDCLFFSSSVFSKLKNKKNVLLLKRLQYLNYQFVLEMKAPVVLVSSWNWIWSKVLCVCACLSLSLQVLRFVQEWSSLAAMKQKLLRRSSLLFHSPTFGLQQLAAAQRPHSSTKRSDSSWECVLERKHATLTFKNQVEIKHSGRNWSFTLASGQPYLS